MGEMSILDELCLYYDDLFENNPSTHIWFVSAASFDCAQMSTQERGQEQTFFQKDPATFPINQQELQPKREQRGPLQ